MQIPLDILLKSSRVFLDPYFLLGFDYKMLDNSVGKRLLTYRLDVVSWKSQLWFCLQRIVDVITQTYCAMCFIPTHIDFGQ